jgi:hypothetical protein
MRMRSGASGAAARGSSLVAALVLWAAGCASAPPAPSPSATPTAPAADWATPYVAQARATLATYELPLPPEVPLLVYADRASFARATGHDEPALDAWTAFDGVRLVDPRRWGDDSEATRAARLTHELCHVAMLRFFADEAAVRAARIPRFFTEGACSVIADQARLSPTEVVLRSGARLPLTAERFVTDPDVAYGAAHALAKELVHDYGPSVFSWILAEAAKDGSAGCVERALLSLTGAKDVPALWGRVVDMVPTPP